MRKRHTLTKQHQCCSGSRGRVIYESYCRELMYDRIQMTNAANRAVKHSYARIRAILFVISVCFEESSECRTRPHVRRTSPAGCTCYQRDCGMLGCGRTVYDRTVDVRIAPDALRVRRASIPLLFIVLGHAGEKTLGATRGRRNQLNRVVAMFTLALLSSHSG